MATPAYDTCNWVCNLLNTFSETLRKYPLTFGLFREAVETYHVPNDSLVIEKGQKIMIPLHSLHYDHRYFSDPETFDPERFTPEEKAKRPNGVYIPFGDGPRICIGMLKKKKKNVLACRLYNVCTFNII